MTLTKVHFNKMHKKEDDSLISITCFKNYASYDNF